LNQGVASLPPFCAIVEFILAHFIISHHVWRNYQAEALGDCVDVLCEWAESHGASHGAFVQKMSEWCDAMPSVNDYWSSPNTLGLISDFKAAHPELVSECDTFWLFYCENGLITTYLEEGMRAVSEMAGD
jgi:hypothetical protein